MAVAKKYVALWDTATREIIRAEVFKDHYEEADADPETGKRPKVFISAADGALIRARCLQLHAEEQNASGAHLEVVVSDEAFIVPTNADTSVEQTTEEAPNA